MAKPFSSFVCQNCGAASAKWSGRCDACGAWNTIIEESRSVAGARGQGLPKGRKGELVGLTGGVKPPPRLMTGLGELDRVAGGGFVQGSAALIGGDPGIGKSTLLLQAMAALARRGLRVIYVSGEEAIAQVQLRAERLSLSDSPVMLASLTNVADIVATLSEEPQASVVVIDSIQTLWTPVIESAPGTVSQLRAGTEALIRLAKAKGICVLFVGHVTKEGEIAGPKAIEHLVDTVLYFEGDRGHQFRILRAVKNRFGPTDEIGVFEMSDQGLTEVSNPSRLFMGARENPTPGSAVFAGIEGTRPLLMEVQALVSPSVLGNPRRAVVGWDQNRLAMVLAVLEARGGVAIGAHDVYLNVAGGLKVKEPAADLAVAAALVSSLTGRMLPQAAVFFGEIALSGSVRPVSQSEARLKEAAKLGLTQAVVAGNGETPSAKHLDIKALETVSDLVAFVASR
ncbi:MAG TPA: DNA repair protein RadA [Aestuariivirgaceae bacterium]|jgi:DNA repair protein RadA/Sms